MDQYERTTRVPDYLRINPGGQTALYFGTYLGFVKDNSDATYMGRLRVWIPEMSSDPLAGLITVNYCSPFAGATPITAVNKASKSDSQISYGFFAVPPDIDNEVIVQFINGDPNRGIWIGCLFPQRMDNMVPGIPSGPTTTSDGKETAPVQEYNKWDAVQAASQNPLRPPYVPLTTGLLNEGLMSDGNRGPSTSSARRNSKPDVLGVLSPGGSQFVLDDNPDNTFIRLRTKSGAQVLINDSIGMVYVISKNGNSWLEVGDDGINAYSSSSISYRSQSDVNLHADGKVNIYGQKGVNIATSSAVTVQATGAINLASGGPLNLQAQSTLSLLSQEDVAVSSGCSIGLQASCNVAVQAQQCIGLTAGCGLYLVGKPIYQNGPVGPTPGAASQASLIPIVSKSDRELSVAKGYPELSTKTIVSVMPAHEPWSGHISSGLGPESKAVNLNYQTRTQAGDSGAQPSPNDVLPGQPDLPAGNDTDYWIPTSGVVSSQFGYRAGNVAGAGNNHPGCDISRNSGNAIVATKSGTVIFAGFGQSGSGYGGYGNCVCIDHGNGLRSIYGHMVNQPAVNSGNKVGQGQFLGNVGATGMVTGPHLHFELRQGGSPFDPGSVLPVLAQVGAKVTAGDPDPAKTTAVASATKGVSSPV